MFVKGYTPWNKGKKCPQLSKSRIGKIPWNKGKKFSEFSGKNNYAWKGDKASYSAIHKWVARCKGFPDVCDICGKKGKYYIRKNGTKVWSIHWSNKSRKYLRNLDDWIKLCVSCHRKYDGWEGFKKGYTPWNKTFIEFNGNKFSAVEWEKKTGIKSATIRVRLNRLGWSVEKTLTTPIK